MSIAFGVVFFLPSLSLYMKQGFNSNYVAIDIPESSNQLLKNYEGSYTFTGDRYYSYRFYTKVTLE
ncbi:hypothetical protein DH09_00835 (plasmid) [Bacillaceae bacterium JMAK1]|nr:hypothetical protein DH09_00835 [Bacillaceae bacterium JMAK1]